MIKVIKHEQTTIHYKCQECGAKGMCSFRPLDRDAAIVIDLKCLGCSETERITLLQYSTEDKRKEILENLDEAELAWVPSFNEEILDLNEE